MDYIDFSERKVSIFEPAQDNYFFRSGNFTYLCPYSKAKQVDMEYAPPISTSASISLYIITLPANFLPAHPVPAHHLTDRPPSADLLPAHLQAVPQSYREASHGKFSVEHH